jgi:hypothetical protein
VTGDWQSYEVERRFTIGSSRGRWVAVYCLAGLAGDRQIRGQRFTSKSRARRFASQNHGVVRRYRGADWLSQPRQVVTASAASWIFRPARRAS